MRLNDGGKPPNNVINFKKGLKKTLLWFALICFFVSGVSLAIFSFASEEVESATPPSIINYQGKLLETSASVTTTKAMTFLIFDADTAGSLLYTAAGTLSSTSTIDITPNQGIFSVNLGGSGTNTLDPSIFQDNDILYLEIWIEGQVMTPRKRLTSLPYAINSQYLMGIAASGTPTTTISYIPYSDSTGGFIFSSTTINDSFAVFGTSTFHKGLFFADATPDVTSNALYNSGGDLYWNGSEVGGTGVSDWTFAQNYGTNMLTPSSTIDVWMQGAGYVSSTLDVGGQLTVNDHLTVYGNTDLGANFDYMIGGTTVLSVTGTNNIFVGENAGLGNAGSYSAALGVSALGGITTGNYNAAVGYQALSLNTTGSNNTAIGTGALSNNLEADNSTAIGYRALYTNTTTGYNIAIGGYSLYSNTLGTINQAVGYKSLYSNADGDHNSAFGDYSLYDNISGSYNVAHGYNSLRNNTDGSYNSGFGLQTGFNQETGDYNVFLGYQAGYGSGGAYSASNNTVVGVQAGFNLTDNSDGNVMLGRYAGYSETGSNKLYIENSNSASPLIYGEFDNDLVLINGDLYIATTTEAITTSTFSLDGDDMYVHDLLGVGDSLFVENAVYVGTSTLKLAGDVTGGEITMSHGSLTIDSAGALGINTTNNQAVNFGSGSANFGGTVGVAGDLDIGANFDYMIGGTTVLSVTGTLNLLVGEGAGLNNAGNNTTFIGYNAGGDTNTGNYNTAVGSKALLDNTSGEYNTAVGSLSFTNNLSGSGNTALGYRSLYTVTSTDNNTAIGYDALYSNSSGYANTAIGANSLRFNTRGYRNTAVGLQSLYLNTTGKDNAAVGVGSLRDNTTGGSNASFGVYSMFNNISGSNNSAFGDQSLYTSTSTSNNVAIGSNSLRSNGASFNTAVGYYSLYSNTYGTQNTGLGYLAGRYQETGDYNTFIGSYAGYGDGVAFSASRNVVLGYQAGASLTDNSDANIFLGYQAGNNETGSNKLYIENSNSASPLIYGEFDNDYIKINGEFETTGTSTFNYGAVFADASPDVTSNALYNNSGVLYWNGTALDSTSTANWTFAENYGAAMLTPTSTMDVWMQGKLYTSSSARIAGDVDLDSNFDYRIGGITVLSVTGTTNLFVGSGAGQDHTDSVFNTALGFRALNTNSTSDSNIAIGYDSMFSHETGTNNIAIGNNAMYLDTDGYFNTAIGNSSLANNIDGDQNVALGYQSLYLNDSNHYNTAIGTYALYSNANSNYNTALGHGALRNLTTAGVNTAVGAQALYSVNGNYNTALGYAAGRGQATGVTSYNNVFIGHQSGYNTTNTTIGNVFIGYQAGYFEEGGNKLYIENSQSITPLIYGEFDNDLLAIHGDFYAGSTTTPVLYADNTNRFVGINSSSPQHALDVAGEMEVTGTSTFKDLVDVKGKVLDPTHVGSISDGAGGALLDTPYSVFVSGNYAYVVSINSNALEIVDISDSSAPTHVGSLANGAGGALLTAPRSVFVSGNYAYIVSYTGSTLEIADISDPSAPTHAGSLANGAGGALLGAATHIFVSGNYAYITSYSSDALEIVDISDPSNPTHAGSITDGTGGALLTGPYSVFVSGNYAYVASTGSDALEIVDISDPSAPTHVGSLANGAGGALLTAPSYVFVSGNYAYVASTGSDALEIVDISDPSAPTHVGSLANGAGGALLTAPRSVFVSGNYAYVVSTGSDALEIVDISSSTNPTHAGSIANGAGGALLDNSYSVFVSGNYAYIVSYTSNALEIVDISGAKISNVEIGSAKIDNLQVMSHAFFDNGINMKGGLSVGSSGLLLSGSFGMSSPSSTDVNTATNTLRFSHTALFKSSATSTEDNLFIFDTTESFTTSVSTTYLLSVRNAGIPKFSVASNGDIQAAGSLFAATAVIGTPGDPGDLAERVDVSPSEDVEPGDVMVVDPDNFDMYKKSSHSYENAVAGIISTKPSITVGDGKTEHTAAMALVGRVPVKVSTENGPISQGDLLVTASIPGHAMKYNPSNYSSMDMVSIIGIALEPIDYGTGKIMVLVKSAWLNNTTQTIVDLQQSLSAMAEAAGVDLKLKPIKLSTGEDSNGKLVMDADQNLNMSGYYILNVGGIFGKDNRWEIDQEGKFVTKIKTSEGDKSLYALQSESVEYIFHGSSELEEGQKRVDFDAITQEIIDPENSIKVSVTLTSDANGVFVSGKDETGFTVKETQSGTSSATFDWVVIASRKIGEVSEMPVPEIDDTTEEEQAEEAVSAEENTEEPSEPVDTEEPVEPSEEPLVEENSEEDSEPIVEETEQENASEEVVETSAEEVDQDPVEEDVPEAPVDSEPVEEPEPVAVVEEAQEEPAPTPVENSSE